MKLNMAVNLDDVAQVIGTMYGIDSGIKKDSYMSGLLQDAHEKTAAEFDLAAASAAGAGYLTHVYEFGTAGITRGPVRFPDPTSPTARLWVHNIAGHGGSQDISFVFRPAFSPNPAPTTESTGVPSQYLRKLSRRKYVFRNKAAVMESGTSVTIRPKNGRLLFVPFYQEGGQGRNEAGQFTANENERGFLMTPNSITTVPGAHSAGTFAAFWTTWWSSIGQKMFTEHAESNVAKDIEIVLVNKPGSIRTVSKDPRINAKVLKSKKEAETKIKAQAARRRIK